MVLAAIEPSVVDCGSPVYPARAVMWDGRVWDKVYFLPREHEEALQGLVEFTVSQAGADVWVDALDVKEVGRSSKRIPNRLIRAVSGGRSAMSTGDARGHAVCVVTVLGTWETWWLHPYMDFYDFGWWVPAGLIVGAKFGFAREAKWPRVDWKLCWI